MLEGIPRGAAVGVSGVVVGEVVAREGTVGALGFVEYWNVRLDTAIVHEPVQHLGRAVGGVADQALGYSSKRSSDRSIMCFAAKISAWRIAVVASTSTMIALSVSMR